MQPAAPAHESTSNDRPRSKVWRMIFAVKALTRKNKTLWHPWAVVEAELRRRGAKAEDMEETLRNALRVDQTIRGFFDGLYTKQLFVRGNTKHKLTLNHFIRNLEAMQSAALLIDIECVSKWLSVDMSPTDVTAFLAACKNDPRFTFVNGGMRYDPAPEDGASVPARPAGDAAPKVHVSGNCSAHDGSDDEHNFLTESTSGNAPEIATTEGSRTPPDTARVAAEPVSEDDLVAATLQQLEQRSEANQLLLLRALPTPLLDALLIKGLQSNSSAIDRICLYKQERVASGQPQPPPAEPKRTPEAVKPAPTQLPIPKVEKPRDQPPVFAAPPMMSGGMAHAPVYVSAVPVTGDRAPTAQPIYFLAPIPTTNVPPQMPQQINPAMFHMGAPQLTPVRCLPMPMAPTAAPFASMPPQGAFWPSQPSYFSPQVPFITTFQPSTR